MAGFVVSRFGKMLSTFEFYKGKTLLGFVNKLFFSVQYKADTKQNMIFFSICWMGAKFQISLHYRILTLIQSSFIKSIGLYWHGKKDYLSILLSTLHIVKLLPNTVHSRNCLAITTHCALDSAKSNKAEYF